MKRMKRWTWVALVALVAVLAVGYSMLAHRRPPDDPHDDGDAELGVEPYEAEEVGATTIGLPDLAEPGEATEAADGSSYEASDSGLEASPELPAEASGSPGPTSVPSSAETKSHVAPGATIETTETIETIEEPEERGETVQSPMVIDDEEGHIESASPKAGSSDG